MRQRLVFLVFFFGIMLSNAGYAQFSIGVGPDVAFMPTSNAYNYNVLVYNENETSDLYGVRSHFNPVSAGFSARSFGYQFIKPKKLTFGYSLEIGYRYFSSHSDFFYRGSSTADPDSIVNLFEGYAFETHYHTLRFNHFFDVHWNPTETIKITNSIGVGLGAIVLGKSPGLSFDGTIVNTNHPIVRFLYQPQITEKYEKFSMTYFAAIQLFAFPLFTRSSVYETPDFRIPYEKIRFNALGLRFVPHFKVKEKPTSELY